MGSLSFIKTLLLIALLVSVLWVFNDAPKYGINGKLLGNGISPDAK